MKKELKISPKNQNLCLSSKLLLLVFLLACFVIIPQSIVAQELKITGKVVDKSKTPVPGVNVVIKGTTTGTMTDPNGQFSLSVQPGSTLVFSFIGMTTKEVVVTEQKELLIELSEESTLLNEVVVVGYGEMSRRNLTTSISKVGGENLSNIPLNTIGEGLKGKIPGVRVYQPNFTPGAEPTFTIRGGSSIQKSNNPLVLVDGIEMSLTDINPKDITSIEILKDAASTSIYGSRGSNGVILVTTNKGSYSTKPVITFELASAYMNAERFYEFVGAEELLTYLRPATALSPYPERNSKEGFPQSSGNVSPNSIYTTRYLNEGESVPEGWKSMPDPLDPSKTLIFQDNNWAKLVAGTAWWQNYNIGITGGSNNMRYAGSLGYTDDGGVAIGTGYNRFNAKINTDIKVTQKFIFSAGVNFSEGSKDEYSTPDFTQYHVISRGLYCGPTQRMYFDNGSPTPGVNSSSPNPLWFVATRTRDNIEQRFALSSSVKYNFTDKIDIVIPVTFFRRFYQYDYFEYAHIYSSARQGMSNMIYDHNLKIEPYINYSSNVFNKNHSIQLTTGLSYFELGNKNLKAIAQGSSTDKITTLNASPTKTDAYTYITSEVLLGYFGRLSYNLLDRYLISGTFRADGSSRFQEGNRWGFFPGISVGWLINKEPLFQGVTNIFDLLKLRISYGQTGNNQVGLYQAFGEFSVNPVSIGKSVAFGDYSVSSKYNGNSSIIPSSMPNEDLSWETTTQLDIGLDFALLNNRISVIADYFDKRTSNLLFQTPLPNTSGFASVEKNVGEVKFYGFDFEIRSKNISKNNFTWSTTFQWSFVKNKVLKLPDNGRDRNRIGGVNLPDGSSFGGIAEGEPLYRIFGYKVDHIIQTSEEAATANYDELAVGWNPKDGKKIKGRKLPGDYEWIDRNNDGKINDMDQFEIGSSVPHSTGGMSNIFQFKNLSLSIDLDWALGHSVYDEVMQRFLANTMSTQAPLPTLVRKTWKEPGDNTKFARFTANDIADGSNNWRISDRFLQDASYLCIRNITLQYDFPNKLSSKLGINDLNIYVSGDNLHYFTDLLYISPETGAATTYSKDYFTYPPVRKFSFGIRFKF